MFTDRIISSFQRIQWKLTLSYTAVTVGSLLVVVLVLGYLLVSRVFIPSDIYDSELSPQNWIRIIHENSAPLWQSVLSQEPIDTDLIAVMMLESNLQVTLADFLRIGDFQIQLRTEAYGNALIVDPEGILLGATNPGWFGEDAIGQPLELEHFPGLDETLNAALGGETNPDNLFVSFEPRDRFFLAIPYLDESKQEVLGVAVVTIERIPTSEDIPETLFMLLARSLLIFLLAAAVIGTIFGALTARGMVRRLNRVSQVTDAWSQGDFSEFIEDSSRDEISQVSGRLNQMAEQLQHYLERSKEIAVSEERNRLARDLHDSAKQEALAASFHLGTALTLFDRDPEATRSHLVEADSLVDSVRVELTSLIHELRPLSMNGGPFDETVNEYIIEWAHQTGIEANFEVEGLSEVPLKTKQAIYRIMQEALANVTRHSSAEKVDVVMKLGDNLINFCVQDNGDGFDPLKQYDGMGLYSMRERVESLGGDFNIYSEPGQGTKVCLSVPIEE